MRSFLIILCLAFPIAAFAQNEDRDVGYIAGLLEDALGGEGREVRVDGFAGALSRTATIEQITIADADGVWLTLSDVSMNWNRSALLRGRIDINELSAESIALPRLPLPVPSDAPDPEAQPFALPELPVAVQIGALQVNSLDLGEPVLGEPARLSLNGSAQLAEGSGAIVLNTERIDTAEGTFALDAAFAAENRGLKVKLDHREGAGGLVSRLLDLPDAPSLELRIDGEGTVSDFTADILLATDEIERLSGVVTLREEAGTDAQTPVPLEFDATLGGDVTALFLPAYREFFGEDVQLAVRGQRAADGALDLSDLLLETRALRLQGQVALNAENWPTLLRLDGQIAQADGSPVLLPLSGPETRIDTAALRLRFDASQGDAFQGGVQMRAFDRPELSVDSLSLGVRGSLTGHANVIGEVLAALRLSANGLSFEDEDVARAIGPNVTGTLDVAYEEDTPLSLSDLSIAGATWTLSGEAEVDTLSSGFSTVFDTALVAQDLTAFAPLIGQDLGGAASVTAKGTAALGGFFDVEVTGTGDALRVGIPQADAVLAGATDLIVNAKRDEAGLTLRRLSLENPQLSVAADGTLATQDAALNFETRLANAAILSPMLPGPLAVAGTARQEAGRWQFSTDATGPYQSTATVAGTAAADGTELDLRYTLAVPDVSPLVPQLPGPLRAEGTARQEASNWRIDTALNGPAGTTSTVAGTVAPDGRLDLALRGDVPLGLANPALAPNTLSGIVDFDLAVQGAPGLNAVSGSLTTANARFDAPTLPIDFDDIDASVALSNGAAQLDVTAQAVEGGNVTVAGPLTRSGAYPADLRIALNALRLVDPILYETTLNGALSVAGPLTGGAAIAGRINVGETNIQVPSTGFSTFGEIPEIVHVGAPRPVMRTLARADLLPKDEPEKGAGPAFPLDLLISAPNRIFVRGRGLDAELGGQVELTGTTANLLSSGRFELVRGHLDVLSKRFELDEGAIQLQGGFEPFLRFVAITPTTEGTASVILDGPASEPEVRFESTPDAPEDQILAQVFFGRDASELSAFQALQLANSIAVLSGRGGVGLVGSLREAFNLDDLDVVNSDEGGAAVRAGRYLSDNVYTDVTVGGTDGAEVSLNIDLTPNFTAKGTVGADSNTSLGIFFERDY